jgi:hypothetical protein
MEPIIIYDNVITNEDVEKSPDPLKKIDS